MLRHSSDDEPGYSRRKSGRGWAYFDEHGKRLTNRAEIDRLNAIALPPAYVDAWFCKDPNGHLQATGKDARGRKQYRYHVDYRSKREASKYQGCREFGEALPRLRARVADRRPGPGMGGAARQQRAVPRGAAAERRHRVHHWPVPA